MSMHSLLLYVHMLFTINTSCWLREQLHSVSIVVIKVENVLVCILFFPVGIMTWKSVLTHRQQILQCWQSKVIKIQFLFILIHSAVLTGSKICFSLFMMDCNVIFLRGKSTQKHLNTVKSSTGNVSCFSGQVFAAWHIFGSLMDNGAKHKCWHVIFPV